MKGTDRQNSINKLSLAGILVTLGIVYGDIGTSPLYTVKAIVTGGEKILMSSLFMGHFRVSSGH